MDWFYNVETRSDLEISSLETMWTGIELPNARPFLVCTAYPIPNVLSEWIDLFEEELSIAQATGLEYINSGRACVYAKYTAAYFNF